MESKNQLFNSFTGMNRDLGASKRSEKIAYEINNMRCTFNGDSKLLEWTNEKGTSKIKVTNTQSVSVTYTKDSVQKTKTIYTNRFTGNVLACSQIEDRLIVFTDRGENYIGTYAVKNGDTIVNPCAPHYRTFNSGIYCFTLNSAGGFDSKTLAVGNFNFNKDYKAWETITDYENSVLQKVYWIDGVNQPRYININSELIVNDDILINFVPKDKDNLIISVEKQFTGGTFTAGTIQYAANYYNKSGAQTNIAAITPIQYISNSTLGGMVDKEIACNFKLHLKNVNPDYEYLRLYSIHRASVDATPSVRIITDLAIDKTLCENSDEYIITKTTEKTGTSTAYKIVDITDWTKRSLTEATTIITDADKTLSEYFSVFRITTVNGVNYCSYRSIWDYCSIPTDRDNKHILAIHLPTNTYLQTPSLLIQGYAHNTDGTDENHGLYITVTMTEEFESLEEAMTKVIDSFTSTPRSGSSKIYSCSTHLIVSSDFTTETVDTYTTTETKTVVKKPYLDFVDYGNSGSSLDYSSFLALNRDEIIPSTFDAKDGTLFFGGYKYSTQVDTELKKTLSFVKAESYIEFYQEEISEESMSKIYPYSSQISKSPKDILGFKGGETYYFGLVIQDYNNKWSSVIPIGSKTNTIYPSQKLQNDVTYTYITKAKVSAANISNIIAALKSVGNYKAIKLLFVEKSDTQRDIICQGVVNSTVFSMEERVNGTAPFAQASWFFRPILSTSAQSLNGNNAYRSNLEWRHYTSLYGECQNENKNFVVASSTAKDYYQPHSVGYVSALADDTADDLGLKKGDTAVNKFNFGVDEQILTLNSPDIEFNEAIQDYLHNNSAYKFRIVGYSQVYQTYADYNISLSQSYYADDDETKQLLTGLNKPLNTMADKFTFGLINNLSAALSGDNLEYYKIYPWHRSSTVDNQNEATQKDSWHFPLKTKVMSNLRYCANTIYGDKWSSDISNTYVWKDTSKLITLIDESSPFNNQITYYGSVDTILTNTIGYKLRKYSNLGYSQNSETEDAIDCKDSIRMKYKSTPHAVFTLPYIGTTAKILPKLEMDGMDIPRDTKDLSVSGTSFDTNTVIWNTYSVEIPDDTLIVNVVKKSDFPKATSIEEVCLAYSEKYYDTMKFTTKEKGDNKSGDNHTYWDRRKAQFLVLTEVKGTNRYKAQLVNWDYANDYNRYPVFVFSPLPPHDKMTTYVYDRHNTISTIDLKQYKLLTYMSDEAKQATADFYVAFDDNIVGKYSYDTSTIIDSNTPYKQDTYDTEHKSNVLYIAELYQDINLATDDFSMTQYSWQEASEEASLNGTAITLFGDTYFQRYDCLKTYPYSNEDPNQIVEIASFMCETRINIDGRYDYNRGLTDNTNCTPENFNLINKAYSQVQHSTQSYIDIPNETNEFPNSIVWSLTKSPSAEIDTWTSITASSSLDLDGRKGKLRKLKYYKNLLLFFQDYGMGYIKYNENVALAASSTMPVELANSGKVSGYAYMADNMGCANKNSIIVTKNSLYFLDSKAKSICKIGENGATSISTNVIDSWLEDQDFSTEVSSYDSLTEDVYFDFLGSKKALSYNEALNGFSSFYDYNMKDLQVLKGTSYIMRHKSVYSLHTGDYNQFFTDWVSHKVTKYKSRRPYGISVICNGDGIGDKIFNTVEFRADSFVEDSLLSSTFDTLTAWNEYQTGTTDLSVSSSLPSKLQHKYRIWRANIPRDKNTTRVNNRMRNPWLFISLMKNNPNLEKTVFHDMNIYYFE